MRPSLAGLPGLLLRHAPRALHVLRTEGMAVLLRKLARRLRTTPLRVAGPPRLLTLAAPFAPIDLRPVEAPPVSIIIPVHNQFSFTQHCLAALRAAAPVARGERLPFEVILVDDASTDGTAARLADHPGLRVLRNPENLGFVGSCNRGAAAARGDYLVFLNNDTQVQPGWLEALLQTFADLPDAGLVGSRLLYPDGRQQEVGALLFADGSAWQQGHLGDPDQPEYGFARPVDYCSGAALAIRADLFRRLDGFDPAFAPAYYEDADLAMRVRAAGFQVYCQPLSRVVHFEGISAGRDHQPAASGLKRFQALHAEVFRARWAHDLAAHGTRDADPAANMERRLRHYRPWRALVVDTYLLTPDRESGSLRMWHLLRILRDAGCQVTFAAANLEAPQPYVSDLQRVGIEVLHRPQVRSLDRHLADLGGRYELVILSRADAAARYLAAARRHCPRACLVFDTVDLHFLREARLAELTGDPATRRLAERRRRQELDLMRAADRTFVVSAAEQMLLAELAPDVRVHRVSNILPVVGASRPPAQRGDLLFIGAFAHPPNRDAVRFFCEAVMPLLRARGSGLRLHVIGADPPPDIRALASDDVAILGYVPDVAPWFERCRLSVAPLRYGAGVKGKINQSLAHGLPVVATSVAVEGMHLVDGESVLIADDAAAFAAAVTRLATDDALCERLSAGGIAVMETHFSVAAAERALREALPFAWPARIN